MNLPINFQENLNTIFLWISFSYSYMMEQFTCTAIELWRRSGHWATEKWAPKLSLKKLICGLTCGPLDSMAVHWDSVMGCFKPALLLSLWQLRYHNHSMTFQEEGKKWWRKEGSLCCSTICILHFWIQTNIWLMGCHYPDAVWNGYSLWQLFHISLNLITIKSFAFETQTGLGPYQRGEDLREILNFAAEKLTVG